MALSGYMIEYHPYRGGTNPDHSPGSDSQTLSYLKQGLLKGNPRRKDFIDRIKVWVRQSVSEANVVVAIAPGHKAGPPSQNNFLYDILRNLNVILCGDLLVRTEEVPKSTDGGPRDQDLHEETIDVSSPDAVKDKDVYIFDDVYTSGATLGACANLVRKAGATNVKIFAVGKTV